MTRTIFGRRRSRQRDSRTAGFVAYGIDQEGHPYHWRSSQNTTDWRRIAREEAVIFKIEPGGI
ncbi:MAG TPA: hypothetical protein DF698_05880 [Candidatus Atribacteria bacterium]|nr:hypothetical protein [Candidatus Atribacteria bacterium]